MVLKTFEFTFKHRSREFKASCTVMDAFHFPGNIMYRVVVSMAKTEHVHIFYKLNKPGRKFYWFPLPGRADLIAKSISDRLNEIKSSSLD